LDVKLDNIVLDTTIQCRAQIDIATVNDYAERMSEGDVFPPLLLYGTPKKCWIGDGWHRVMAVKQLGFLEVDADVKPGGRVDALRCALSANAVHGQRRSNKDKRRCVEIALKEFPKLSSSMIAEMCGVSHTYVDGHRPNNLQSLQVEKRIGKDGKERPATRRTEPKETEDHETILEDKVPMPKSGPPSNGMYYAELAVMRLEEISKDDLERTKAFNYVKGWIENES